MGIVFVGVLLVGVGMMLRSLRLRSWSFWLVWMIYGALIGAVVMLVLTGRWRL
jgi:hypothetical protein